MKNHAGLVHALVNKKQQDNFKEQLQIQESSPIGYKEANIDTATLQV